MTSVLSHLKNLVISGWGSPVSKGAATIAELPHFGLSCNIKQQLLPKKLESTRKIDTIRYYEVATIFEELNLTRVDHVISITIE